MSIFNPVTKIKETCRDFLSSHLRGKTVEEMFAIAKEHIERLGLPVSILEAYPTSFPGVCASGWPLPWRPCCGPA